jgi:hypothetical protein
MLKKGEIVERGNYKDLMAKKGEFYDLVKIQTQETVVKKRKKNIDREIEKLEKKLSVKKLNTMIRKKSERSKSKKETKPKVIFSKLKIKHLSSMTKKW